MRIPPPNTVTFIQDILVWLAWVAGILGAISGAHTARAFTTAAARRDGDA